MNVCVFMNICKYVFMYDFYISSLMRIVKSLHRIWQRIKYIKGWNVGILGVCVYFKGSVGDRRKKFVPNYISGIHFRMSIASKSYVSDFTKDWVWLSKFTISTSFSKERRYDWEIIRTASLQYILKIRAVQQ